MARVRALALATRIIVVIGGGYALMAGFAGLVGVGLARAGMARSEAVLLSAMLAFLVYLGVILWGFHAPSVRRVTLVIGGGAIASIALALLLAPSAAAG